LHIRHAAAFDIQTFGREGCDSFKRSADESSDYNQNGAAATLKAKLNKNVNGVQYGAPT
jgi:hypothetical protein